MRSTPHLYSGIIALLILIAAGIGFDVYARSLEHNTVNALAPLD